jgi:hypothetical protein
VADALQDLHLKFAKLVHIDLGLEPFKEISTKYTPVKALKAGDHFFLLFNSIH